jgi:cytochrome c oxidase subunit 3
MNQNFKNVLNTKHPFHLVNPSPWPFYISFTVLNLALSLVWFFHYYQHSGKLLLNSIFLTLIIMAAWWRDVIIEGTYEGQHTQAVQKGLRLGIALFILSEVMFFFGFFWAFFHSSLSPAIQIGGVWPPKGIIPMSYLGIPFLNTIILLTSGVTVTWFHYLITSTELHNDVSSDNIKKEGIFSLGLTVLLGLIFLGFQAYEYIHATFTISDGVYGSTFYLLTGFHGFHVIVGTLFLFVCLLRYLSNHFTEHHHIGLEAAIWYWHFVDVVWLFLYISIYWWGDLN